MRLDYTGPICLTVRMTLLLLLVHPLPATPEIVKNGLLTEGIANMPTGWQHEAFFADLDSRLIQVEGRFVEHRRVTGRKP